MATKGTINLLERGSFDSINKYVFTWTRTDYSAVSNTSTIAWELGFSGGVGGIYVFTDHNITLTIEGLIYTTILPIGTYWNNPTVIRKGTITIPHNPDGYKTATVSITEKSSISSRSDSGTFILDPIDRFATIYGADHFNDEENPTIMYDNPSGSAVESLQACISFTGQVDDIAYRDIPVDSITFFFLSWLRCWISPK